MRTALNEHYQTQQNNLVLKDIEINVSLQGLMAQTEIVQTYANDEARAIEAIYTFPLPLDAVLMALDVELDGKIIQGRVTHKTEALEHYEDAISDGDTAVLLEKADEGLFTLNLGNLLPGQTANIKLVFAQLYQWTDNQVRFFLPTVIAPRYGQPGLEPQQLPEIDLSIEHRYRFTLQVEGVLARADMSSPSHALHIEPGQQQAAISATTVITLEKAFLDRDLVINFTLDEPATGFSLGEKDGDNFAAIASFKPAFDWNATARSPKALTILIDCSGSMGGDSIELAKKALLLALDELQGTDWISIIRFGSSCEQLTKGLIPASKKNLALIHRQVRHTQADLGGTELFAALDLALTISQDKDLPEGMSHDLFLITDGEVWDKGEIKNYAQKMASLKQRVFSIGIGSAVSTPLVIQLAEKTGGAYELVAPNEKMVEKIHRHFKRLFMPSLSNIEIDWGTQPLWQQNRPFLFDGDTYQVFAQLEHQPDPSVRLKATTPSGEPLTQTLAVTWDGGNAQHFISRLVAHQKLQRLDEQARAVLAVEYQLMDDTTAYLMVEQNPENTDADLPQVRKVPQMLAAGWGNTSRAPEISMCMSIAPSYDFVSESREPEPLEFEQSLPDELEIDYSDMINDDIIPVELRSLEDLSLTTSTREILNALGIQRIGDLIQLTGEELLGYPDIDETMLEEIQKALARINLHLGTVLEH